MRLPQAHPGTVHDRPLSTATGSDPDLEGVICSDRYAGYLSW